MLTKILMTMCLTLCSCNAVSYEGETNDAEEVLWACDVDGDDFLPYLFIVA